MGRKDKFLGALLGAAVGDALGAPFEGRTRHYMRKLPTLARQYQKMTGYPTGQYTDDTQMTLALCEAIINKKKVLGEVVAKRFATLWRNNSIIGEGAACRAAMMRIIVHNTPWDEAGVEEGQAGNGSAMRTSPIGLFDCDDPVTLRSDAITQSIITHKDERASAGAVALSAAISFCVNSYEINPDAFIDHALDSITGISQTFSDALTELREIITLDDDSAFMKIATYRADSSEEPTGITAYVVPTVLAAFYHFLRTPPDWAASVEHALRWGGDTDTLASITGALSGAYNGIGVIPTRLIDDLKDHEYIYGIALKLYSVFLEK